MPDALAPTLTISRGFPVEIGRIDRELKKLWEQGEGAATRASLINLAIYCEGEQAMAANTELIANFTQTHACRAILICNEPDAPQSRAQAWIGAHCHVSRAGAKQVCCEQITFLLEGRGSCGLITNIVFSHLDSDLPLYLWWQGELAEPIDAQLWKWVDRLVFDSHEWSNPKRQFARLRNSLAEAGSRLILCDLNWARVLAIRHALAQMFDHPENLRHLHAVESALIGFAPGFRSTAVLFAGWLMAQLGWRIENAGPSRFSFARADGGKLDLDLIEKSGPAVGECTLTAGGARFVVATESGSEFLHADVYLSDGREYHHLRPPGKHGILDLLDTELTRGGKHGVYLNSLAAAEPLL
jgi:glucose-6-phosphate dehydrogenase assembly protein OpcA